MIEYNGLPLFGDDSNPRNTSKFLGLIGTFIVWFIFLLCMIIIRPAEKEQRKYKDVQIVFEALPPLPEPPAPPEPEPVVEEPEPVVIEEAVIETPEVVEEPKEKPVEKKTEPVVKKPNREKELSKKDSNVKTQLKKDVVKKPEETAIKESKKEGEKLQPDMTNPVFPEKQQTKPVNPDDIWERFDKELAAENTEPTKPVEVKSKSTVEGTAGTTVDNSQQPTGSKSSKVSSGNEQVVTEASGKTKGALSGIKNVIVKGDGGRSEISFKGRDGDGGYFMDMGGGGDSDTGGRGIISPKKPTITLSDDAISEIDVTKSVTVHFTVLPDGNVVEVSITPASSLPPSVINEIKNQVSSWRFRSSIFKSQGEFKYTIKVN